MRYLALSLALVASCSSDEPADGVPIEELVECPETFDDGTNHVVVVRDASIDPRLSVFAGKVNGCFSIVCKAPPSDSPTREQQLARLGEKNTDCHLEKNLRVVRSSTLDNLADAQAAWNRRVFGKQPLYSDEQTKRIANALGGEGRFSYHGTAVASTIAFDNPSVRFVFIKDPSIDRPGAQPKCPTVDEIDQRIRLLTDPEYITAYAAAPTSTLQDALVDVYRRHRVTIINESYGPRPAAVWEELCPGPRFREYFVAAANIEAERRKTLESTLYAGLHVLTVASAGNDAATLQNSYDHYACIAPDSTRGTDSAELLIGAYSSYSGNPLSEFTNRGSCVDAYAPGEGIIAAFPAGWVAPWSGTSLSAPLVTRLLTRTQSPATPPKQLRAAILAARDSEGRLPFASFDSRMIYTFNVGGVMTEFRSLQPPMRFEE